MADDSQITKSNKTLTPTPRAKEEDSVVRQNVTQVKTNDGFADDIQVMKDNVGKVEKEQDRQIVSSSNGFFSRLGDFALFLVATPLVWFGKKLGFISSRGSNREVPPEEDNVEEVEEVQILNDDNSEHEGNLQEEAKDDENKDNPQMQSESPVVNNNNDVVDGNDADSDSDSDDNNSEHEENQTNEQEKIVTENNNINSENDIEAILKNKNSETENEVEETAQIESDEGKNEGREDNELATQYEEIIPVDDNAQQIDSSAVEPEVENENMDDQADPASEDKTIINADELEEKTDEQINESNESEELVTPANEVPEQEKIEETSIVNNLEEIQEVLGQHLGAVVELGDNKQEVVGDENQDG